MRRVEFLGTGDAFHGGGRGHSAMLVEDACGLVLVECGATVPHALARRGVAVDRIDAVVVSHLHGDHFAGLAFLYLDAMFAAPRTRPLVVAGPRYAAARIEALFRAAYASSAQKRRPFLLDYRELEPGDAIDLAGRRLVASRARHMSGDDVALSYRLETGGRVLAWTGDTAEHDGLPALADGADLFVCECSSSSQEAPRTASQHLSVEAVRRLRPGWNARRVVLTHLSAAAREEARSLPGVEVADDGTAVDFDPVDGV